MRDHYKEIKLEIELEPTSPSIRVQAGKVLVVSMTAFITTKLAEGVYEMLVARSKKTTADPEQ